MAKIFGEKSKYLIGMDYLHRFAAFFIYLLLIYLIYYYLKTSFTNQTSLLGILIITLIYFWLFLRIDKRLKEYFQTTLNYKKGRKAEYEIVEELKTGLPDNYQVFQDIKINKNRGNIDLVVIGRTGVFALEVKSHKGNITFENNKLLRNGSKFEKNFLDQTMGNALELNKYLSSATRRDFFVKPVLVFESESAFMHFSFNKIRNINIIQKKFLNKLIIKDGDNLSEDDLELLKGVLDKATHKKH